MSPIRLDEPAARPDVRGVHPLKQKSREWLRRYALAELIAMTTTLVAGLVVAQTWGYLPATAVAGTWGENLGYYGTMLAGELRGRRGNAAEPSLPGVLRVLRNLVLEFGLAELLDSFAVRPASMFLCTKATGSVALGLLLGKLVADLAFYLPTIAAYELRKHVLGE